MKLKTLILILISIVLITTNISYAQESIRSSVRTNRAYALYEKGDYQKASTSLDESLKINPADEKARKLKIEICLKQNDVPCADYNAKQLIEYHPESAYGYYYQAKIYDELAYQKKTFETAFVGFRYPGLSSAEEEFLFNVMLKNADDKSDIGKIEKWMESTLNSKRFKPEFYAMAYEKLIEHELVKNNPRKAKKLLSSYYKTFGEPSEEKKIFWASMFNSHNEYNTAYMLVKDLPSQGRIYEAQMEYLVNAQRYKEAGYLAEKYFGTFSYLTEDQWYQLADIYDQAGLMEADFGAVYEGIAKLRKANALVPRFYIDLLSLRALWEAKNYPETLEDFEKKLTDQEKKYLERASKSYKKQLVYAQKLLKSKKPTKDGQKILRDTLKLFEENGDWRSYARSVIFDKSKSNQGLIQSSVIEDQGTTKTSDMESLLIKKLGRKSLRKNARTEEMTNLARVYMQKGNTKEADRILNNAIERSADEQTVVILGIAQSYADLENYEKAIEICKKLLKKHPNDIDTLTLTAYSYIQLENYKKATQYLEKAYALLPNARQAKKVTFTKQLANLYAQTNQPEVALEFWEKYLQKNKSNEAYLSAAITASLLKNVPLSSEYLTNVNVNNLSTNDQAEYWKLRASNFNKKAKTRRVAGGVYRVALALEVSDSLWATYSYNQSAIGNLDVAEDALFRAMYLKPNDFTYLSDMTYLQKRMGKWPEAKMHAHKALDLPKEDTLEDGNRRYDLKTTLSPMERHFKFYAADVVRLDTGTFAPGTGILPNASYTGYGGIEGYYTPWLDDSKRKLAVKGRVFWSNYDKSFRKVKDLMAAGLGVRYQPFQKYQLFLSGERIIPIGSDTREDWLLLMNGSLQDGLEYEYLKKGWSFYSLYAQAGYLTETSIPLASATLEAGHHFKLFHGRQFAGAIAPIIGSETVTYDKDTRFDAMVGLILKTWHWENDIRPHRLHARLAILRRKKLGGNVNDDNATHLRLELFF